MTNRQVVAKLRELGHEVEVYVRKDGSIRVTSLDGKKYSSRLSEGVQAARDLLFESQGIEGSAEPARYEAAKAQRAAARASRKAGGTLRSQSKDFQNLFKKFQREVKKINKRLAKEGKRPSFQVSWKTTKEGAAKGGITPEQQLQRAMDYFRATSQGIAPAAMVAELEQKLILFIGKNPELQPFLSFLQANRDRLDIYETKRTIDWVYGYVQDLKQSETLQERLQAFTSSVHAK